MRNAVGSFLRPARLMMPALLWLAGCAGQNHAIDVIRQTSLSATVKGEAFMVLLSQDQGGDPAFKDYAGAVVSQLQAQGLTTVNDPHKAHYAVMFDRSWPHQDETAGDDTHGDEGGGRGAGMGGGGGGMGHGGGGFGGHHHDGTGGSKSASSDTSLRIAIFDLTKPKRPDERVFFAKVHAPVGKDDSDTAIDAMIGAALKDFPGKTHETYTSAMPRPASGA